MVALVGDYILIIGVGWISWIMENGGQREKERERLRELERERLVTSFFLFVVAQVADFVVHLSIQMFLTLS